MDGQNFVSPDHVLKSVPSVLGHRVVLSYEAAIDKIDARSILMDLAKKVI
jgi:MoxR-like ATPase